MDLLRRLRFLTTLIIMLGAVACGTRQTAPGYIGRVEPPERPILRVLSGEDPRGLDPTRYSDQNSWRVARLLFEGLTAFTSDGGVVAGVAERWDTNDDFSRYTFYLRPNARWSNGTGVSAEDFIYAWRRVLDPQIGAATAEYLYPIRGARAINEGQMDRELLGARALSETVLEVELEYSDPDFPARTALPPLFPVPGAEVSADYTNWPRGESPVCNGPFTLTRWQLDTRLEATRSTTYWNRDAVQLEGVVFLPVDDVRTSMNLYRTGAVDWTRVNEIPLAEAQVLLESGAPEAHTSAFYHTNYLELNTRRPPLDDPRVRRSLELTVPREQIAEFLFGIGQRPSRTLVPPDMPGWTPPGLPSGDAGTARRLLAEAGYPGGTGLPVLSYLYNTGHHEHAQVAELLQGVWQQELGIRVELVPLEFHTMVERGERGEFHILRSGWLADLPTPMAFLEVFKEGNPNNPTGWWNPRYDALLEQARSTLEGAERYALMREAEEMLLEEVPIIPILQSVGVQLIKPYVSGLQPNPLDVVGWTGVRLDTEWKPPK